MQSIDDEVEMRYKAMLDRCNVNICSRRDISPEPSQNAKEDVPGEGIGFERIRRITGYLVGDVSRWNNGKKAELNDRVKHEQLSSYDTQ